MYLLCRRVLLHYTRRELRVLDGLLGALTRSTHRYLILATQA